MKRLPDKLTPVEWGLPAKFAKWRKGQWEAVMEYLDTPQRFIVNQAPTGSGKTLRYVTLAHFLGVRTAIITANKGLQQQLMSDFGEQMAFVNIKGKSNYACPEDGNCQNGHISGCTRAKSPRCAYSAAVEEALVSRFVVTNYTYWILKHRYGPGLGQFDLLVFDEAHAAPDELSEALAVRMRFQDLDLFQLYDRPHNMGSSDHWRQWGQKYLGFLEAELAMLKAKLDSSVIKPPAMVRSFLKLRNLHRKVERLAGINPLNWVAEVWPNRQGVSIEAVNPGDYAHSWLFVGYPAKVMLLSATLNVKTLEYLGLHDPAPTVEAREKNRRTYHYCVSESTFDPERGPIYSIPCQTVDHKTPGMHRWLRTIDAIVKPRRDRKGIIHTVSFDRRNLVVLQTEAGRQSVSNYGGDVTAEMVEEFKTSKEDTLLVSPSIPEGYDFPYSTCEYQIIGKVPFPDSRSAVVKERQKRDKLYGPYIAMQTLQQMAGRPFRAEDDRCETFIIDDHFRWFIRKYRKLASKDFLKRIKFRKELPPPPPKLKKIKGRYV